MHAGEATTRTAVPLSAAASATPSPQPNQPPADEHLTRARWVVVATLAAVTALAALRLSFVQGLVRRITIDGPSMAPALLGPHYSVTCSDCRFPFTCDAEHPPRSDRAVCPNCGYADNELVPLDRRPAQRVLIDRWPLLWRSPPRGEIVAARLGQELIVKRVAGLPGEVLSIEDGDVFSQQQIVGKTPAQLRAVRVLVHDNDFQPQRTPDSPPRWRGAANWSQWQPTSAGSSVPANLDSDVTDWLEYEHWECTGNPLVTRTQRAAIRDLDAFNQGDARRELMPVYDVHLTCRIQARGEGTLALAAVDRGFKLVVLLELAKRELRVVSGDRTLARQPLPAGLFRRPEELLFGLCDQQLLLLINGRKLLCLPYDRSGSPKPGVTAPLAIGAGKLAVDVTRLQVWRDLHYLPPSNAAQPWQTTEPLGPTEVALLGDNPPVSIDSRQWSPTGVPTASLLGRVYRPFWAK